MRIDFTDDIHPDPVLDGPTADFALRNDSYAASRRWMRR
jgi:hypothetical protein